MVLSLCRIICSNFNCNTTVSPTSATNVHSDATIHFLQGTTFSIQCLIECYQGSLIFTFLQSGCWIWLLSNVWHIYPDIGDIWKYGFILSMIGFVPLLASKGNHKCAFLMITYWTTDMSDKDNRINIRTIYGVYVGIGFALSILTKFEAWASCVPYLGNSAQLFHFIYSNVRTYFPIS